VATGLDVARAWDGHVTRDTVKRGCMTTAYGVTKRGMRDQLIDDAMLPEDVEDETASASYMRDVMWDAIGSVVVSARNTMDWLQTVAADLGSAGVPFSWTTPAGSTIQQAYRPWIVKRPMTAFGRVVIASKTDRNALKVRKQAMAAAPNYVHSFDAAHMALTINQGASAGITHWATIHDSYGTHAARMDVLNRVLREEFVAIYREDWLTQTYKEVRERAPGVKVKRPPERGGFDIEQVNKSEWFFA
jgi:DNA-directed RNA polymerase